MKANDIDVFVGIDVGKSDHWATALASGGKTLFDKALPNDETRLRDLYSQLSTHGRVLVVVDQPATIGALAVAVAQDMGVPVAYLPGLSMRRIADLAPGNTKTDHRDAQVIAQAERTMPHTLRAITTSDEDAAALSMLTGFDLDLARQVNQVSNRIRGLYTQVHPALEAVLGPWLEHGQRPGGDRRLAHPRRPQEGRAGADRRQAQGPRRQTPYHLGPSHRRGPGQAEPHRRGHRRGRWPPATPGTPAHRPARPTGGYRLPGRGPGADPPSLARPPPPVPGIRVPAAAVFLAETLGKTFDTGAQLASYAGLTPVTRRSGSSIRGEHVSHAGNKRLKRAMFPSAFASIRTAPVSRAYYEHKRAQGKHHNQALLPLAHRRVLTLQAMLTDGTLYDPQPAPELATTA